MKHMCTLMLAIVVAHAGNAQWAFTWSGYAVDLPSSQWGSARAADLLGIDQRQWLNGTRVRLRPALLLWTDAQLSLEYEVSALYHSSEAVADAGHQSQSRQVVDLSWTPVSGDHWRVMHYIDRLHFKQGFAFGDLTVGRQRIAWGTGRIWNPTDLFNPLDRTDYAKIEKDGTDAILTKFSLASFTDITLVCNPGRRGQYGNAGIRIRTNVEEFDFSVMGGSFDGRGIIGGDCAGNFFGAGVRGEAILSQPRDDSESQFAKWILGMDYQFTGTLYGLLEYHFNGEGTVKRQSYDILRLARGEILNVAQDYLALGGTWLVTPLVTASAMFTANLNDGSDFLSLSTAYAVTEECALALGGQVFSGQVLSEFWYYPNAFYLKADIYF